MEKDLEKDSNTEKDWKCMCMNVKGSTVALQCCSTEVLQCCSSAAALECYSASFHIHTHKFPVLFHFSLCLSPFPYPFPSPFSCLVFSKSFSIFHIFSSVSRKIIDRALQCFMLPNLKNCIPCCMYPKKSFLQSFFLLCVFLLCVFLTEGD